MPAKDTARHCFSFVFEIVFVRHMACGGLRGGVQKSVDRCKYSVDGEGEITGIFKNKIADSARMNCKDSPGIRTNRSDREKFSVLRQTCNTGNVHFFQCAAADEFALRQSHSNTLSSFFETPLLYIETRIPYKKNQFQTPVCYKIILLKPFFKCFF